MLAVTPLLLISLISKVTGQDLADQSWFNESMEISDEHARASKYDWTGVLDNSECTGNVLRLNPGEATRVVSHKSFGQKPYPSNYRVSLI